MPSLVRRFGELVTKLVYAAHFRIVSAFLGCTFLPPKTVETLLLCIDKIAITPSAFSCPSLEIVNNFSATKPQKTKASTSRNINKHREGRGRVDTPHFLGVTLVSHDLLTRRIKRHDSTHTLSVALI